MKKLLFCLFVIALIPLQACAQAAPFEEGKHYNVIAEEATAEPQVVEYFSFWCPACFRFEPLVAQLKQRLPEGTDFEKVHVNFMRFNSPEIQDYATQAMMIAQQLDKKEALTAAIFNYIHVQQQGTAISKLEDFRNLFIVNGVDGDVFDKHAKSFAVKSLISKNNKAVMAKREHLTGVPNFIVNGKYQVIQGGVQSADDFINLVIWLSEQR